VLLVGVQLWEVSKDAGATWSAVFDGTRVSLRNV
jgi:hypothetical protein